MDWWRQLIKKTFFKYVCKSVQNVRSNMWSHYKAAIDSWLRVNVIKGNFNDNDTSVPESAVHPCRNDVRYNKAHIHSENGLSDQTLKDTQEKAQYTEYPDMIGHVMLWMKTLLDVWCPLGVSNLMEEISPDEGISELVVFVQDLSCPFWLRSLSMSSVMTSLQD